MLTGNLELEVGIVREESASLAAAVEEYNVRVKKLEKNEEEEALNEMGF